MNSKQFSDVRPQHGSIVGSYAVEKASEPAPIPGAMSELTCRMDDLSGAINSLARMLEPVLVPPGPIAGGTDCDARCVQSPLRDFLSDRSTHCSDMVRRVQDLMNRLEV